MMTAPPDYLLIGHIAHDVTPQGPQLGGTVSFAAHTAAAFGLRVAVLTSAQPGEPLLQRLPDGVEVLSIPAGHTTQFDNRYTPQGRVQYLYHRATPLEPAMIPPAWRQARLVHLAPIAYEVDPSFVDAFPDSPICVTPQGWMRQREPDSRVTAIPWAQAVQVLPRVRLAVLSEEDIRHDPGLEEVFARLAPVMVLTRGEHGGTVYRHGQSATFSAFPVQQVDPTGAGDVFATALHIALDRLDNLGHAIQIAARLAAISVTRSGFASAPTAAEINAAWTLYAESPIV